MNEMRILHESNIFEYNHFRQHSKTKPKTDPRQNLYFYPHFKLHPKKRAFSSLFWPYSLSVTYLDTPASG